MSQQIENRIQQISDEISTWLTTVEEKVAQELTDEQSWETFWSYWLAANSLRERHSACYVELNSLIYDQETNSKVGKTGPTSNAIKLAAEWTEARLRSVRATLSKDSERKNQSQASPAEPSLELEQLLPLSPRLKEALHSLCKGERIIRHQLLSLPIEVYDQEALLKQINLLDHRLIRNNLDTQLTDLEEARRALDLVHSTRFVKRLFAAIEGLSGGFQADLVSETFSIGEVSWYQRALKVAKVEESYGEVYRDGLKREVEAYSLRAEEMCARLEDLIASSSEASKILDLNEVFAQAWRSLLWGGELLITLNASPVENIDDLITECRSVRASIRDKILESEKLLDDRQYEDIFTELTWELFYYSSDLLSEIDHSAISSSIFRLECVSQDLNWFLEDDRVQKTLKAKNKSQHLIAIKRIEKQRSWVRVELQEKRLQAKLEQTFGQRRVRHFEQLIFVLIFVVLGLLLVELFWVPETDHETRKVLALIDTAICFIFLTEFIVKISLATERLFYFKRRWFIDLLPSIPFVLFTDFLLIDHMVAMRSVRLVYVSRISRYIRIVRPFIRIIRLVSFSLRGLDRLVRRYSQWINHNLVFFEPSQSIHHRPVETELEKATSAYADSLSLSPTHRAAQDQ